MKNVKNKTVHRIRFNDYEQTIHIQYRGSRDGKHVGWSEIERPTPKEYFKRKLQGK